MTCLSLDLTIDSALADPMVAAAMRADHVDPRSFERLLRSAARNLADERPPQAFPLAQLASRVRGTATGCMPRW